MKLLPQLEQRRFNREVTGYTVKARFSGASTWRIDVAPTRGGRLTGCAAIRAGPQAIAICCISLVLPLGGDVAETRRRR